MTAKKEVLIGAHFSTAGGVSRALREGKQVGATTAQLFTSNQKQWKGRVERPIERGLLARSRRKDGTEQGLDVFGRASLVDSAEETAKEVELLLKRGSIVRKNGKGAHSFFVTDAPERLIKVGRRFLGEKVESAVRIER